jgi:glutathione peroxidase
MSEIYSFSARRLDGAEASLADFRGKVLLIVNTASKCGFTPQYAGLEALQKKYVDQGFTVLGFPCDQFGHQEPGDAAEIASFCTTRYDVTFPMFAKIEVNGAQAHPLWSWLKSEKSGFLVGAIKWNFTKFLISRTGEVLERFPPTTSPDALSPKVELALKAA